MGSVAASRPTTDYPVPPRAKVNRKTLIVDVATAINADLQTQPAVFGELTGLAPVGKLQVLDVLAWHTGRTGT